MKKRLNQSSLELENILQKNKELKNSHKRAKQSTETLILSGAKMPNTCIANIKIQIDEVWTMERFELAQYAEYPKCQRYFMYGDEEEAFLSHIVTKQPDFYQVKFS